MTSDCKVEVIIQEELEEEEKKIPMLCEMDRKPKALEKNLGPCVNVTCARKSKYVCPKCMCNYCGLECYKSHSETCVNKFYEENVKEELKGRKTDEQTQKRMREMLSEYKEQLDNDRQEYEIPHKELERLEELEDLMLQNQLDLDDLTIEEQNDFNRFLNNNKDLQKYILPWKPWWQITENLFSLYVEEIDDPLDQSEKEAKPKKKDPLEEITSFRNIMKTRIKKLISFKHLCKLSPHPDLKFQLSNILTNIYTYQCLFFQFDNKRCGFVLTLRIFNGEIFDNPLECLNFLVSVSMSLNGNNRVEMGSVSNAMNDMISNALRIESVSIKSFLVLVQEDLVEILKNKVLLLECLFRLFDLLHEGQMELRDAIEEAEDANTMKSRKENMKTLGQLKQKIIYYLSFTKDALTEEDLRSLLNHTIEYNYTKQETLQEDAQISKLKKLNLLL